MSTENGSLESNLEKVTSSVMQTDDVRGVVCCNNRGDLYSSRGTMNDESAAIISHLSALVGEIEAENPVIQLEGSKSRVLIHKRGEVIVGVHKEITPATAMDLSLNGESPS
ncbi:Late endosomal/lysosomal adaptor and MAPK and MTOR activator 5 [Aphelenchoides besseyi]|nr:Late endosomal/lysosomal adaptor and MAPK and MTOR activator 5 [Aphelenchoides besseyi]KAI6201869.1 Late endosomal/lysosomal adaptor and MAPK and MTOR activator 5 [Aphelenchoides besseyi]